MPIEILMPALSPTMEEGTLSKWLVKEGDTVSSGDLLAEIETDKATMEVEAVEEGTIAKIIVTDGTDGVKVNAPIAILLEEDEDASALDGYAPGGGAAPAAAKPDPAPAPKAAAPAPQAPAPKAAPAPSSGDRIKASPLAKRLAKEAGIDLAGVTGSGPNGRIVKADIDGFSPSSQRAPQAAAAPTATTTEVGAVRSGGADYLAKLGVEAGTYDLEPLDGMRKVIAKRLSASNNNVPDFPLLVELRNRCFACHA